MKWLLYCRVVIEYLMTVCLVTGQQKGTPFGGNALRDKIQDVS